MKSLSGAKIMAIVVPLAFAQNIKGENSDYFCNNVTIKYIGPNDVVIKNMPLEIRTVSLWPPKYYDEIKFDMSRTQVIEKEKYRSRSGLLIELSHRFDFDLEPVSVGIGLNWNITIPEQGHSGGYWVPVSNSTGTRDIYETPYYTTFKKNGVIPRTKSPDFDNFLAISPEAYVEYLFNDYFSVKGFISYFHLQAEKNCSSNGDDRTIYSLSHHLPVSLSVKFLGVEAGIFYPKKIHTTQLGKEANISIKPTFFIGLNTIGWNL